MRFAQEKWELFQFKKNHKNFIYNINNDSQVIIGDSRANIFRILPLEKAQTTNIFRLYRDIRVMAGLLIKKD